MTSERQSPAAASRTIRIRDSRAEPKLISLAPANVVVDLMRRVAAPCDFNSLKLSLLRDLVMHLVDFAKVRKSSVKVFTPPLMSKPAGSRCGKGRS